VRYVTHLVCATAGTIGFQINVVGMARRGTLSRTVLSLFTLLVGVLWGPNRGWAQQENQFGGQDRANAARQMIILGVQQGIATLPPMSGQAFSYEYDPASDTYVRSKRLGPTSLRSPQTVGAGHLSLRVATSYFDLGDNLGPIPYRVQSDQPLPGQTQPLAGVALLGLNASAKVGVINVAATYGIMNRLDMTVVLPIVIVDAHASQVFSSATAGLSQPPNRAKLASVPIVNGDVGGALQTLENAIKPGGPLVLREESFSDMGFAFNGGTHAGVGRISVGGNGTLYANKLVQVSCAPEFFFPSPSEAQFAGSDSAAILPRLVAAFTVASALKLHVDAGYDYDFDHDELRRFTWDTGASIPGENISFDFGMGGSKFNQGIQWTPTVAKGARVQVFPATTATALGDTRLGDNFVDFLAGFKVRITEQLVVSGAVSVPVTNDGFRAAAVGTLALEFYL
jgi:hypothetical protein